MHINKDAHMRSIVKVISYRLVAAVATTAIAYTFTHRITLSVGIGAVEAVVKIVCYYVHERVWAFINFGRSDDLLSTLPLNRPLEEKDLNQVKEKLKELGYISGE